MWGGSNRTAIKTSTIINSSELSNFDVIVKIKNMPTADRRKRKREEMRKAEAASCRNLMKFFSRYIKCQCLTKM
jgi:hypothetical protein